MPTRQARTETQKKPRNRPMSDEQIAGFIGRKVHQAMNDESGDLSDVRKDVFNRYNGELYGNERAGYSKFVTREVLETIEWVMPSILRVFTGSDRVVSFDAVNAEDEERAEQETDVVNHKIMKSNGGDGFLALHHFMKDALMFPTAYIKTYVEEVERVTTHTRKGIDSIALMLIEQDEANTIKEYNSYTISVPMGTVAAGEQLSAHNAAMAQQAQQAQQPPPPPVEQDLGDPRISASSTDMEVFDVTYTRSVKEKKLRVDPVPGEQALVDKGCTSTNLDTSGFNCHRTRKTFTELVELGFDKDKLENIGNVEDYQWNDESTNRMFYEDEDPVTDDEVDPSMRRYWLHDCHLWIDVNGDGIAEFRHITMIGHFVFVNEETDFQPMVGMSSILMPHKHNGLSIAQIVQELQDLKTTLTRQLLDNLYRINVRRTFISEEALLEDGTTMEAMLNVAAEWIPVKGAAVNAAAPQQTPSIAGEILPVLQSIDEQKSNRTGINPQLSLDPNVLQQSTEGAFAGALEQASQRIEMLVRIFAETGIKQLMRKVHQLMRTYPDIATTVKIRGQWIPVNAESWDSRTDMTANVGLGFNDKRQMTSMLIQTLGIQERVAERGLTGEKEVFNTLEKLVEVSGMGDVNRYFVDPKDPSWQPPQPPEDPNTAVYQAQAQALVAEQARKDAEARFTADHKTRQQTIDAENKMRELTNSMERDRAQAALKTRELDLREMELELRAAELDLKDSANSADIRNTDADTNLKQEMAIKQRIEGMVADANMPNGSISAQDVPTETGQTLNDDE